VLAEADLEALEVRPLLSAIHAKYGYRFIDYAESSMRRRVYAALMRSGLPHLAELERKILLDPSFFASLVDEFTVRASDLFRDPAFFRAFRQRLVPILRTYPMLKIWHAGCASGEEVYTTAILLAEENLYERAQIYATDVSPKALELAQAGVYAEERAAPFERNYLESGGKRSLSAYLGRAHGRMAVCETLRQNVVFFQHDLTTDHGLGEMHVVFCRNVLLYFGSSLRERVLSTFAGCLDRAGFLCLGMNEGLSAIAKASFADFAARERIFRRRSA